MKTQKIRNENAKKYEMKTQKYKIKKYIAICAIYFLFTYLVTKKIEKNNYNYI